MPGVSLGLTWQRKQVRDYLSEITVDKTAYSHEYGVKVTRELDTTEDDSALISALIRKTACFKMAIEVMRGHRNL